MPSPIQSPAAMQARRRAATSIAALTATALALLSPVGPTAVSPAEAKTPGKTYCFHRVCHRVMTLDETRRAVGRRMVLHASHYDDPGKDRYNPSNLTSSGEWFRAGTPDNAASPTLPNGTVILAWNPATKQSAVLRVNNAGPYWGSRTLDVSRAAAASVSRARAWRGSRSRSCARRRRTKSSTAAAAATPPFPDRSVRMPRSRRRWRLRI